MKLLGNTTVRWVALLAMSCSRDPSASGTNHASESSVDEPSYRLTIEAPGPFEKDKEATALVRLTAKGDYKVNAAYPFRFRCQDRPEGLRYTTAELERKDGKLDEKTAEFSLPFVPMEAGNLKVGGVLSLSVCTEAKCIMDKREVVASIAVP
ncbi:MAG TPA: hypothetical protein PLJ27_02240 [Polyangiaceae bacterium]|jgi:hypothetical protein|nr:MAG: hypothetical protein BWY17_02710 [Deltaproteobacteria bacterium ADurb.Bin207]HNS99335.1 hypothetical protein [Polyangiaceae bacterium]HNZ24142.1 hypothetical protein [Polyangiaceae bacterium]HOD23807.1 hypothetical protein [Polyangiaceae bacterium]HOE48766.1 hypothetical protein [Polyangiaceae bacterium]